MESASGLGFEQEPGPPQCRVDIAASSAWLTALTLLCARKLQPYLEGEGTNCLTEHYIWRAIEQASRVADKIEEHWPEN